MIKWWYDSDKGEQVLIARLVRSGSVPSGLKKRIRLVQTSFAHSEMAVNRLKPNSQYEAARFTHGGCSRSTTR